MDALLLIDVQEDFFAPEGLARRRTSVVAAVWEWVERARRQDAQVIEIKTVLPDDPSTWALNMRDDGSPMALEGQPGTKRLAELAGLTVDATLHKRRDDAFHGTDLATRLRVLGATRIVIAGVSTEACVAMTAASAYAHDLRADLAGGAIASADDEAHEQAVGWLRRQYRQSVLSVSD